MIPLSVTTTNLLMGPATVYLGLAGVGTTEPADAAINATPAASAWLDLGGTDGGVSLEITPKFSDFQVDQIVDTPGSRLVSRTIMVNTTLSEVTLANLGNALNSTVGATGANYATFEPNYGQFASQLPYATILMDGWAPSATVTNARRRIILRRVLQSGKVGLNYTKDKQVGLTVQWQAFYVSSTVAPFHIADQTA
jgi:hypothetical protein